jgi:hypothetical protein
MAALPIRFRIASVSAATVATFLLASTGYGAGGTSVVASKGHAVRMNADWPDGLDAVLNHELRANGWNPWFSGWPSELSHYELVPTNTAEVNSLIAAFAAIKADKLLIQLSPDREPSSLGWVSGLPKGNGVPLLLTFCSQRRLDEWHRQVPGAKARVKQNRQAATAAPPKLTIYVQNRVVKLDQLAIPENVQVTAAKSSAVVNRGNSKAGATNDTSIEVDVQTKATSEEIDAFLRRHACKR